MVRTWRKAVVAAVALAVTGNAVLGAGMMIPRPPDVPPLAIDFQRVDTRIDDLVARTLVRQAFVNSTGRQLEATYVFPLPPGASVTEFAMTINGKRVIGELLERDKARTIYQDIVRRMRDPGLLEYVGGGLFQARVFPIPAHGRQEVEVRYSEVVTRDAGVCRYVYPLRTGDRAATTLSDFTVTVGITSSEDIKTVYSPSHEVDIVRRGETAATVGFEAQAQRLDRDFSLLWTVSEEDVGLNLISRRTEGQDGFFMLMVSPRSEIEAEAVIRRDVVFVLDTSGSMSGNGKLGQAKQALTTCVNGLNPGDRFNVVRFSTEVQTFRPALVAANPGNVTAATEFIAGFPPRGGTNISDALDRALSLRTESERPFVVVFLTDGIPTVGETDPQRIIGDVAAAAKSSVRIFCFGVGYDVNTHLLDRISGDTRGVTEYVEPEEDIEVKVSLFFNKIGKPVLASAELDFGGFPIYDVYPKPLPDLFAGTQLLVFGRYSGKGGGRAIRLRGEINGEPVTYTYEGTFAATSPQHEYVEHLWATRKIGYLLDEIRLHGEDPELRDEVVELSRRYGVVTPYTSYLVVEDEGDVAHRPPPRGPRAEPALRRRLMYGGGAAPAESRADNMTLGRAGAVVQAEGGRRKSVPFTAEATGAAAVRLSRGLTELKQVSSEAAADGALATRVVGPRRFSRREREWVDQDYSPQMRRIEVRYGSSAYFRLLELRPELAGCLALGERVTIVFPHDRVAVVIGDRGTDELSEAEESVIAGAE